MDPMSVNFSCGGAEPELVALLVETSSAHAATLDSLEIDATLQRGSVLLATEPRYSSSFPLEVLLTDPI